MREPFHDSFARALTGDTAALDPWWDGDPRAEAGLAVYRNTVAKGRADVLAAAFPSVARLVGDAWFEAAALRFAADHPPADPAMDLYGEGFPDWLERFPPARGLPYLAPVARLDRAFAEAHAAADAPVLDAATAAALPAQALYAARAELHPSARLFWFGWTVPGIWIANRWPEAADGPPVWAQIQGGLLVVRPRLEVTAVRLDRPGWAFLEACRRGRTLGEAAQAAWRADPARDLRDLFADLIRAGAFARLSLAGEDR